MRSACLSSPRRKDLVFHLCEMAVTPEHKRDLDGIADEFGATVHYYDLAQNSEFKRICGPLPSTRQFPPVTYARLVLDRILPSDVERVIYLDSDTLVLRPIERLYEQDMKGNPIAAVADPFAMHHMMGRDMRNGKGDFDPSDAYFNSGVLLIDMKGYIATDIPARLEEFLRNGLRDDIYFDQDLLNLIFLRHWTELSWRFNAIAPLRPLHTTGANIVHYTRRPWGLLGTAPYRRTYRHVMTNEIFYRFMRHRWKRRWVGRFNRLIGRK